MISSCLWVGGWPVCTKSSRSTYAWTTCCNARFGNQQNFVTSISSELETLHSNKKRVGTRHVRNTGSQQKVLVWWWLGIEVVLSDTWIFNVIQKTLSG